MGDPSACIVGATALLEPATGVGVYTREVARRLPDLLPGWTWGYHGAGGAVTAHLPESPDGPATPSPPATRRMRRWLGTIPGLGAALRDLHHRLRPHGTVVDVYWEPNNLLDLRIRARHTVLTIHDLSWQHHPQWHPRERIAHFRRAFDRSWRAADAIITGSHHTKAEILGCTSLTPGQVHVIHHGVDTARFTPWDPAAIAALRQRHGLDVPFILSAGTLEPRKNLDTLLTAWTLLPQDFTRSVQLVIAGARGWKNSALHRAIDALGSQVRLLGYVPAEDLPGLYSAAEAFVYPSLYEGFGLPPVEATACGCPVVIDEGLPAREVLTDALAIPARDPHRLAEALLLAARRTHGIASVPSWETSAVQHARVLAFPD